MNGRSAQRLGDAAAAIATAVPDLHFTLPQGYVVPPQFMAMWARRHQHEYGSTCEDLGRIATTQRAHASVNPHAIARTPLDDYLAGRWINEPLRVFDCAFEVDGAVALVITSAERARHLAAPPVRVLATADSHGHGGSWDQWSDPTCMYSAQVAPRLLKRVAGERSGLGDVDVACIYDCFSYTVMAVMEDFGFAGKGEIGGACSAPFPRPDRCRPRTALASGRPRPTARWPCAGARPAGRSGIPRWSGVPDARVRRSSSRCPGGARCSATSSCTGRWRPGTGISRGTSSGWSSWRIRRSCG